MKLSIAIADTHALPSAFVVYRGFTECIPKAARLGFDGVELALKRADEINVNGLQTLLDDNQVAVSCISTGQVYAEEGLMFTDENPVRRARLKGIFKELIDLAQHFGKLVNIGRVRGQIGERPQSEAEHLFVDLARELCDYALPKGVTLMLEPVNRYEIDFINSVEQGVALMKKVNRPNMMLMPDVFHMNIEDRTIGPELAKHIDFIHYIHFADSNRLAPGQGHIDFRQLLTNLHHANYDGWVSVEILPIPDPDTAARQSADFLLPLIKAYNQQRLTLNGLVNQKVDTMEKLQLFIEMTTGGYALKVALVNYLTEKGYTVDDVGCHSEAIVRYPYYAAEVAKAVLATDRAKGILLCSTGIGMSIIANKFRGIRAALCYSSYQARMTSAHNNSNILCLGGRCVGVFEAQDILDNWLETPYEGGRHDISLGLIQEAEQANFSDGQWMPPQPE